MEYFSMFTLFLRAALQPNGKLWVENALFLPAELHSTGCLRIRNKYRRCDYITSNVHRIKEVVLCANLLKNGNMLTGEMDEEHKKCLMSFLICRCLRCFIWFAIICVSLKQYNFNDGLQFNYLSMFDHKRLDLLWICLQFVLKRIICSIVKRAF